MLWLPTAAAEPRHVISLCYIRPVWMNNEECLSLQNIPASLLLPCAPFAAPNWVMLGLRNWGSGEKGWRDEGEHRGDWERNQSSSHPSLLSFFRGVNYYVELEIYHTVPIFVFLELLYNFLKTVCVNPCLLSSIYLLNFFCWKQKGRSKCSSWLASDSELWWNCNNDWGQRRKQYYTVQM